MFGLNKKGLKKNWILEIHFVDEKKEIGGFFEQLLA
jgi:Xaa-Pro dipeptidase